MKTFTQFMLFTIMAILAVFVYKNQEEIFQKHAIKQPQKIPPKKPQTNTKPVKPKQATSPSPKETSKAKNIQPPKEVNKTQNPKTISSQSASNKVPKEIVDVSESKSAIQFKSIIPKDSLSKIDSIAFSQGVLASGNSWGDISLWNFETGQVASLQGHSKRIESLCFSPDGNILASGGRDAFVCLWNIQNAERLAVLKKHPHWVTALCFSPNGKLLASGSNETIRLSNTKTGKKKRGSFKGHESLVLALSFHPGGKILASGSSDKTIRLWTTKGREIQTLFGHSWFVETIAFHPSGEFLASGSSDKTIRFWDTKTAEQFQIIQSNSPVFSIAFNSDGTKLAAGCWDGSIKIWNVENGQLLQSFSSHNAATNSVLFTENALISGGFDGMIKLWNSNFKNSSPALTFVTLDREDWAIFSDDSSWDCSPNAKKYFLAMPKYQKNLLRNNQK